MSTCLTMPRNPSCTTHQSWPGVRRRRVSQPSIHLPRSVYLSGIKTPRPGLRRFSFSAKNSSFAINARPPTRSAARSTMPGGADDFGSAGFIETETAKSAVNSLAPAVGAVGPWGDEEGDVIFGGGVIDAEADGDAIEEAAFAKIIANAENDFVGAGEDFLGVEQG